MGRHVRLTGSGGLSYNNIVAGLCSSECESSLPRCCKFILIPMDHPSVRTPETQL
ncbi:hypothetical protein C1H46_041832 [Malus baccata]|uniref:Uncharacterized protein n=1 Tax=Malus baccata TaxID=106549 RepID=A0A540KEI6_MALBA|nr:hypothetical protein C1H46_041832 [Malus baccata]